MVKIQIEDTENTRVSDAYPTQIGVYAISKLNGTVTLYFNGFFSLLIAAGKAIVVFIV